MFIREVAGRALRWLSPKPAISATPQDRQRVSDLVRAGRDYVRVARTTDLRHAGAVAALYRDALDCFLVAREIAALSAADAAAETVTGPASIDVDAVGVMSTLPLAHTDPGKDALHLLHEPHAFPSLTGRRTARALDALDRMAMDLVSQLFPATEVEARRLRLGRRLGTSLLLISVIALAGRWLMAPHNVARGKKVTASSAKVGSPEALVNGAIEWGSFGLHTYSGSQWATIDLGRSYALDFADIYGRGDGRIQFNLPLHLDLSDDGVTFRPGGACSEVFTQSTPCVVPLATQRARYVRLSATEVVLSEVEVYGKP
jgi:hypothetical protein